MTSSSSTVDRPATWLLPAEAYTSADWLAREQRDLFSRTWVHVASVDQLARPGDFVSTTAAGEPLVVLRDQHGEIRAFYNACPHRQITLVEGCGNAGRALLCPYHHWNFSLDGTLRSVPQAEQFPGLDKSALGLEPVAVAQWGGMVFVNLAAQPEPFEQWLGAFPATLGLHDPGRLEEVNVRVRTVRSNWKFLVENTIEVYHLWYLHRTTQDQYQNHLFRNAFEGRHWWSYTPLFPDRAFAEEESNLDWTAVPVAPWLGERERSGIFVHLIFPNVCLFATALTFRIMTLVPDGPEQCAVEMRTRALPGTDPALFDGEVNQTFEEDVEACERIQKGAHRSRFRVGPLAKDHERPIGIFQANLLEAMGTG